MTWAPAWMHKAAGEPESTLFSLYEDVPLNADAASAADCLVECMVLKASHESFMLELG